MLVMSSRRSSTFSERLRDLTTANIGFLSRLVGIGMTRLAETYEFPLFNFLLFTL